jgi:hypothetical protein
MSERKGNLIFQVTKDVHNQHKNEIEKFSITQMNDSVIKYKCTITVHSLLEGAIDMNKNVHLDIHGWNLGFTIGGKWFYDKDTAIDYFIEFVKNHFKKTNERVLN